MNQNLQPEIYIYNDIQIYSGSLNIREADLAQQHKTFGSPFIWWWRKIEEIHKILFLVENRQYIYQLRCITLIFIVYLLL